MSDIKGITIEVPEIEDFEAKIIAQVAHSLLHTWSMGDGEREDGYTYDSRLANTIRKEMVEAIKEQAREQAPLIAAEILEQGVYRVDTYGDRTGERISLKTLVAEEVTKSMTGYNHGRKDEIGKLAKEIVHAEVTEQMRGALASVTEPVLEHLRAAAVETFVEALKKALPGMSFKQLEKSAETAAASDDDGLPHF